MRLDEEIQRWQDFLDSQQRRREHDLECAREQEMGQQQYPHDLQITASLNKWKVWKEYQAYFQRGIDRLKRGMEGDRRAVEAIQRKDPDADWSTGHGKFRGWYTRQWLDSIKRRRKKLIAEKKRLE